eukprot:s2664_g13.t1
MRQNLPPTLLALFEDKDYQGNGLLALPTSQGVKTPTAAEVSLNYVFLLPTVQAFPSKVPSAYLLTDIYLELDRLLDMKVFRPTKEQSRLDLAAIEGCKTKKCLGALRTLWRSSGDKGHNDRVTHLKSLLVPSPRRGRNHEEEQEEQDEPAPLDDDQGAEREDPEPENEECEEEGELEGCQEEQEESGESGDEVSLASQDVAPTSQDDVASASQDSGSHLNSPTLRLDDCHGHEVEVSSMSSEDSMPPDSQVPGAGWMGRAMMAFRPLERQEKEEEKRRDQIKKTVGDIRFELMAQCRGEQEDYDLEVSWHSYKDFCFDAIQTHGEDVIEKLASKEFFFRWLREEKATPAQAGF